MECALLRLRDVRRHRLKIHVQVLFRNGTLMRRSDIVKFVFMFILIAVFVIAYRACTNEKIETPHTFIIADPKEK